MPLDKGPKCFAIAGLGPCDRCRFAVFHPLFRLKDPVAVSWVCGLIRPLRPAAWGKIAVVRKAASLRQTLVRLLTLALPLSAPSLACSCRSLTLDRILESPVVFIGQVTDGGVGSIRDDPWYSPATRVRLRVLERFRGVPKDTASVELEVVPPNGMCSPNPYYAGGRYLVTPRVVEGKLVDGMCFTGRDVQTSGSLVDEVRLYFAGLLPIRIRGRAAVARDADSVDFLLRRGEAKPLAGVTISATGNGKTYRATTDTEGRYTLLVPRGRYQLRASKPPYSFGENIAVTVDGMVAERDIAAQIDTSICGHVWDERGQPVKSAKVGLIDREPKSGASRSDSFRHEYTDDVGKYCFAQVPLGQYLVVFNPEGPRSDRLFDTPHERSFYPSGSSRTKGEPVTINAAGTHRKGIDLVMGAPVALREVTVTVSFPDGAPMKHAQVRCIGEPRSDSDTEWTVAQVALESGEVRFHAPAARKLRIEVKDWYGRDLKTKYESSHEPGTGPIAQKVIVTP